MIDLYLVLTPILTLIVIGLARFVACDVFFPLKDPPPDAPTDVTVIPGDRKVDLEWTYPIGAASEFRVYFSTVETDLDAANPEGITVAPAAEATHGGSVSGLTNGTLFFFRVEALVDGERSFRSDTVSAVPTGVPFVVTKTLGLLRNDFQGWVGMAIEVGATAVRVTQLGRIVAPANVGTHDVKIVDVGAGDVDVGAVSITMPAGASGEFAYVSLDPPVDLLPFRRYHIVSHEEAGGDSFHDLPTTVTTTSVAQVLSGVFNDDAAPGFVVQGGPGQMYVPVDFVS